MKMLKNGLVCIGSLLVIGAIYFFISWKIDRQIIEIRDDFSWVYQVEETEIGNDEILLRGFAFELDIDAIGDNYELVLKNIETGRVHYSQMRFTERADVNKYFECTYDYIKSGFEAVFKLRKRDNAEGNYEIFLWKNGDRNAYKTGVYLSHGTLMYTNPTEFKALEVTGTDLEEVVGRGVLRVYRPEYGIYVYQYNNELYWIAGPNYEFENGDTYIQCQMYTTQVDKLRVFRSRDDWTSDKVGFMFSVRELIDKNTGMYRVAKCPIPKEYSITKIETGKFTDEWIWYQYFRPYYEF